MAETGHRSIGIRVLGAFRRWPGRLSGPGLAGALVLAAVSLGPALTPRPALYQGLVAGICAAIGYGLGVLLAWLLRTVGVPWSRARSRWFRRCLLVATVLVVPLALWWNATWQDDLLALFGEPPAESSHPFVVLVLALVVAVLLLQVGRGLRQVARWVARLLGKAVGRWVPVPLARLVAVALVAWLALVVLDGTLVRGGLAALNDVYAQVDDGTADGVTQPSDPLRSGSPGSMAAWDELGLQGRSFVAGGRPLEQRQQVADLTDRELVDPIRVYAGLRAGDSLDEVAQVVVAELDRTHAWDRSVLAVVTATGTGWIDPSMSDSLELLWGGDTAIASMQYSYLPSWVSFVGDRSTPPAAGKALFEAVYARWSQLPADDRPLLYVAGISLGSYGSQGAFSSVQDVTARTDGALWLGTPGFTDLWGQLTEGRDAGSREVSPVVDGGTTVRFANRPADGTPGDRGLWELGTNWDRPRIVYEQHASDGVVWWSPHLILNEPDRLTEPRGSDVLPSTRWVPLVTFWQTTIDLFVAGTAPAGHGHNYHLEYADGWAAVAPPDGWTQEDTATLREVVGLVASEA
ncbi:alpha/beta-hydrolase family protein [Cellulomonas sp. DKR-3]|uniref:Alpha/beta-hydrolase family protein n=1 Tax=Cellulomonas fulva TaxID=2835530 RepID=A0ABS5U040_9CELL|nr:alpha/beta-hydrolase family protein [Cellulomonas fulva]MBT0994716.1 alpha/beta-hydrolase family protein [Cellulomonas fulva]